MILCWKQTRKAVVIIAAVILSCFHAKADPVRDSIKSYIHQNFFDTTGLLYEGISWKWTDTVYTNFERSPEGVVITHRAESLQQQADSLEAVIADRESRQGSSSYIDSLRKVMMQNEKEQGETYDHFADGSKAYTPIIYGYKMEHTFRYGNLSGRMVSMKMIFIFDKTKKIVQATIEQ